MPESGKLEHQYKLYLICSILNIIQHSLKFRSALYALSRLTFIGILIYDFHILKFCISLEFFFLGIHVPKSLLTPIAAFADATSPVALFVLGGTLHFNAIRGNLKYLVPALSLKLLVLPAVMLALGYAFGLRDLELFLLVAIYGTPVAAASYPMAQNMGGDGELAGQFVVISTVVAVGTLFGWIFFMKSVGLI